MSLVFSLQLFRVKSQFPHAKYTMLHKGMEKYKEGKKKKAQNIYLFIRMNVAALISPKALNYNIFYLIVYF